MARRGAHRRTGFTLVEIVLALTILSGSLLGLARFMQTFTRQADESSVRTMANDLARQRIEAVKAFRPYASLVTTYHNTSETWAVGNLYRGFTRQTWAVRTGPTATHDYVTVTVQVSGRRMSTPVRQTTIIARF